MLACRGVSSRKGHNATSWHVTFDTSFKNHPFLNKISPGSKVFSDS